MNANEFTGLKCVACGGVKLDHFSGENVVRCAGCRTTYPIHAGILQMLPRTVSPVDVSATSAAGQLDDQMQAEYWDAEHHAFRTPDHFVVRTFAEQRWRFVTAKFDMSAIETALDLGCGDGFSTRYAPPHLRITACDRSLAMLRRHHGQRRVQADAFELPFQDNTFDLVYAWEMLHHVSEPYRVLGEMCRVTRKYVVCFEPNPYNPAQFLFAYYDRAHRWQLRFSKKFMFDQCRRAGLAPTYFARGGCIFPNKTPEVLVPWLRSIPYRIPWLGISNVLIAEKRSAHEGTVGEHRHATPMRQPVSTEPGKARMSA